MTSLLLYKYFMYILSLSLSHAFSKAEVVNWFEKTTVKVAAIYRNMILQSLQITFHMYRFWKNVRKIQGFFFDSHCTSLTWMFPMPILNHDINCASFHLAYSADNYCKKVLSGCPHCAERMHRFGTDGKQLRKQLSVSGYWLCCVTVSQRPVTVFW